MAPLYSRYVPPKPSAAPEAPRVQDSSAGKYTSTTLEVDKKRKRERSENEKAERKAKKLRKKGAEDAAEVAPAETKSTSQLGIHLLSPEADDNVNSAEAAPQGEFAHVKSAKKRHKLEKEARKARKQAEKVGKQGDQQGGAGRDVDDDDDAGPGNNWQAETTEPMGNGLAAGAKENEEEDLAVTVDEKRRKRRRKHEEESEEAGEDASPNPQALTAIGSYTEVKDIYMQDATEVSVNDYVGQRENMSQPKKRRHKLEAALQQSQDQDQVAVVANEEDEHLKNHSSVMSKFQKARQLAEKTPAQPNKDVESTSEPQVEKRDLAPFPQPVNEPESLESTFSALPSWLAKPTTISNNSRASFAELQLSSATIQQLAKQGFEDALPVQQALIPLLLPPGTTGAIFPQGTESILPDVAVSATTGSGKTLAYLLPMIEAMQHVSLSCERLRALVVVPTRELVAQVASVAGSLAKPGTLKVGTASGVGKFKDEQQKLVRTGRKYDPAAYAKLMAKAKRRNHPPPEDSDDFESFLEELEQWNEHSEQELQDTVNGLPDHVPTYSSAVDILVCTPGRLLEHVNSTLGFSLTTVEWLVLDEADKLLDQQYDGLLQRLNEELSRPRSKNEQDAREKVLRTAGMWDSQYDRRVRKVVLSATMTRDISKLVALKLRRPKMVVVQGAEPEAGTGADATEGTHIVEVEGGVFELPPTLQEYYVPVGDGSEKPLFLLELLRTHILTGLAQKPIPEDNDTEDDSDSSSDTSSSADSESSISSSDETSTSGESSSEDSSSDSEPETSDSSTTEPTPNVKPASDRLAKRKPNNRSPSAPTVLIFTSSTESAARLSYLLSTLEKSYKHHLTTLTKNVRNPFPQPPSPSDPIITVATDRAGRGLDTLAGRRITHVLQYDVPRSVTGYVHRVGRTARAGLPGEAWTLYSEREARWFVNEIVRAENVRRRSLVEKARIGTGNEVMRRKYEETLTSMRDVVFGGGGAR